LPRDLLLLGEHELTGVDVVHGPAPGGDEGCWIIQVEMLGHGAEVVVVAIVVDGVEDVLATLELVFVLLLNLLPSFEGVRRAVPSCPLINRTRGVSWSVAIVVEAVLSTTAVLVMIADLDDGVRLWRVGHLGLGSRFVAIVLLMVVVCVSVLIIDVHLVCGILLLGLGAVSVVDVVAGRPQLRLPMLYGVLLAVYYIIIIVADTVGLAIVLRILLAIAGARLDFLHVLNLPVILIVFDIDFTVCAE